MNPAALVMLAVGAAALTLSARRLTAAYPGRRLPHWRNPPGIPRAVIVLRVVGVVLVLLGAGAATSHAGWVAALVLVAWAPALAMHMAHNRRVGAREG